MMIRIVSPSATVVDEKEWKKQKPIAESKLRQFGFEISYGMHVEGKKFYKAGTWQERVEDIHEAFVDPSVDLVMCTQGGDNSNELLPHLDWELIRQHPKPFLGSSDITVLLNAFYQKTDLVTYHGTDFLWGIGKTATDRELEHFHQMFVTKSPRFESFAGNPPWRAHQSGSGTGILLGGCLPSFHLLLDTEYNPLLSDRPFLFLMESIGQTLAIVESQIAQLTQQPAFQKNCRGIILGYFHDCKEEITENNWPVSQIILSYMQSLTIPIVEICELGHCVKNLIFPIGKLAHLEAMDSHVSLTV